jgi:MYXO-CTERM domain-containing protein
MRPVRITALGASASLPLRMVAVGTGAITPLTLWVIGEGRYEPTNFSWFTIGQPDIVWNWDTSESNYSLLRDEGFKKSNNENWLIQSARQISEWSVRSPLEQVVSIIPDQSGYGDPADGYATAYDELTKDMDAIFGGLNEGSIWMTRMNAELARQALGQDLNIGAAVAQTEISNFYQATKATGTPPKCPVYDPCPPTGSNNPGGVDTGGVWWGDFGDGKSNNNGTSYSASCAVSGESNGVAALVIMGLGLGVSISRRRRMARSDKR